MIVRLIDVVLNILFGFIIISDIDIKGALSLPAKKTKHVVVQMEKKPKTPVFVEIQKGPVFNVALQMSAPTQVKGVDALEKHLQQMQAAYRQKLGQEIAIIIKPDENSDIQSTVDVLDMCDRNRFPKNIARASLAIF
jgi:biopolymer transport protein ExbD